MLFVLLYTLIRVYARVSRSLVLQDYDGDGFSFTYF